MKKIIEVLKKIKLRNIIILIILLAFNTYAWFIFNTRVSMNLNVHVASWDIEFLDENEDEITTNVTVAVDRAYPGMDDFEQTVTVKNNGEVAAELDYKITKIEVMGDVYDINAQGSTLTSQDLEDMLDDYPFSVSITINDTALQNMTGDRSFYSKFRMAI